MRNSRTRAPGSAMPRDLSAVVVYPNCKSIAFANLGFLKTYGAFAERLRSADVAYLPGGNFDPILSRKQGRLLGQLSGRDVRGFDIVGFSVSYENDFANLPRLLIAAGMPALAQDRSEAFPLVVCGGFTMSMNPLPIADFVDVVVVGEVEPAIEGLLDAAERAKDRGLTKAELLESLAGLDGVWVPALGERPVRRVWSAVDRIAPEPSLRAASHFGDMVLVEMGRGCGQGCLFCAAGNLYRPVRMRDRETILGHARGAQRVGLVGTAVGGHPALVPILRQMAEEGRRVGLASLRADEISPEIADLMVKCGARTITLAPEAGSEGLRTRIGKRITREQIERAVTVLAAAGVTMIKLYFMIGLPGESDEDVEAIVALVRDLAGIRGRSKLSVAAGPFVPKPQTAFQWCPFADRATLKRRVRILRAISATRGCTLRIGSLEEAWIEAVLSRGGRELSRTLLEAAEQSVPIKALLKRRPAVDVYAPLDIDEPLPWDFIDAGVSREGLKAAFLKSGCA